MSIYVIIRTLYAYKLITVIQQKETSLLSVTF